MPLIVAYPPWTAVFEGIWLGAEITMMMGDQLHAAVTGEVFLDPMGAGQIKRHRFGRRQNVDNIPNDPPLPGQLVEVAPADARLYADKQGITAGNVVDGFYLQDAIATQAIGNVDAANLYAGQFFGITTNE
jgi:hypothetical protein